MRLRLNIDESADSRQANKNISAAVISVIDTRSINCESKSALFRAYIFSRHAAGYGGDDENIISVLLPPRQEIGRKRWLIAQMSPLSWLFDSCSCAPVAGNFSRAPFFTRALSLLILSSCQGKTTSVTNYNVCALSVTHFLVLGKNCIWIGNFWPKGWNSPCVWK